MSYISQIQLTRRLWDSSDDDSRERSLPKGEHSFLDPRKIGSIADTDVYGRIQGKLRYITKSDRGCDRVVSNFATDAILYLTFLLIKRKYFSK